MIFWHDYDRVKTVSILFCVKKRIKNHDHTYKPTIYRASDMRDISKVLKR